MVCSPLRTIHQNDWYSLHKIRLFSRDIWSFLIHLLFAPFSGRLTRNQSCKNYYMLLRQLQPLVIRLVYYTPQLRTILNFVWPSAVHHLNLFSMKIPIVTLNPNIASPLDRGLLSPLLTQPALLRQHHLIMKMIISKHPLTMQTVNSHQIML